MRVPPLIKTMKEVKKKIELLEALGDIQVSKYMFKKTKKNLHNYYNQKKQN